MRGQPRHPKLRPQTLDVWQGLRHLGALHDFGYCPMTHASWTMRTGPEINRPKQKR